MLLEISYKRNGIGIPCILNTNIKVINKNPWIVVLLFMNKHLSKKYVNAKLDFSVNLGIKSFMICLLKWYKVSVGLQ